MLSDTLQGGRWVEELVQWHTKAARSGQAGQSYRKNTAAMAGIAELMEMPQSESKAVDGQTAHEGRNG